MEGIKILGQINSASTQDELSLLIGCGIVISFFLYNGIRMFLEHHYSLGILGLVFSLIFMSILYSSPLKTPVAYYQVSISDEVSFNDVMEKYNIISCNKDNTYTISEKRLNNND